MNKRAGLSACARDFFLACGSDVRLQIASWSEPADLISLSETSRLWNTLLLSKSAHRLWRAALRVCGHQIDLGETELLKHAREIVRCFLRHRCQICSKESTSLTVWFRRKMCLDCKEENEVDHFHLRNFLFVPDEVCANLSFRDENDESGDVWRFFFRPSVEKRLGMSLGEWRQQHRTEEEKRRQEKTEEFVQVLESRPETSPWASILYLRKCPLFVTLFENRDPLLLWTEGEAASNLTHLKPQIQDARDFFGHSRVKEF